MNTEQCCLQKKTQQIYRKTIYSIYSFYKKSKKYCLICIKKTEYILQSTPTCNLLHKIYCHTKDVHILYSQEGAYGTIFQKYRNRKYLI